MDSIIQKDKECYVCHTTLCLHSHHIFFGSNRKNSEKYGMKVWLCGKHHNLSSEGVHQNRQLDLHLKKLAQERFEAEYGGKNEFLRVFGKNYL